MTDKKKTLEQLLENTRRELYEQTVYNNQPDPKIVLPVFKSLIPDIIAREIIGVQPMTSQPMSVGEMDHACSTWYWVAPPYDLDRDWENMVKHNKDIQDWCHEIYGDKGDWADPDCRWWTSNRKYIFKNEEDRTMFVIRWS